MQISKNILVLVKMI